MLCFIPFLSLLARLGLFPSFFSKKLFVANSSIRARTGKVQNALRECVGVGGLNSSTFANANASAGVALSLFFLFWFHSQILCYSDLANGRTFVITEFERIL